jgi:FAD/FMN-containing dehydrogenase
MDKVQQLEENLRKHLPHVHYVTLTSPDYAELREAFTIDNPAVPIAIARPKSAEDVAALIQYAVNSNIEISVRTGGHDLWGRCFAHDSLAIDMRDIAFVHVADDRCSAKIGGGTLTGGLVATLAHHKLATATGNISSVGYLGWATHGGYGPFLANFGLGVDQS